MDGYFKTKKQLFSVTGHVKQFRDAEVRREYAFYFR